MRILITGGAGFIGSNFIHYVLEKYPDYEIVNLDKLTYCGNIDNLKDIEHHPNYTFIRGDVADKKTVEKAMKGCDYVVHFAAESHVDNALKGPLIFTETNVLGTHVLLEVALKEKIKKFHYVSTDETYGSIKEGSFSENDMLNPTNVYSATKVGAEALCMAYYHTYGMHITRTRCSNNVGPYQYPEKFIPKLITNALDNKPLPIYGTGKNVRDWIYVIDHCRAIDLVLHEGTPGEIYNVCTGNEIPNIEVAKRVLKELGKPESLITFVEDRKGHDFRYSMKTDKIRKLGWKPLYSFDDCIKNAVKWYKENEWWWRKLI
ncbi:MAG: dTDP-glucose 4,6-dehydratase [Thermoprotei archaeon]|nr:MAG: dTDP-glucose 4,6-dehydratase [Thermoprotei archaeon]